MAQSSLGYEMQQVRIHEILGGQGLMISTSTDSKYQTWVGSENVEIERVTTMLNIDPCSMVNLLQPQMRTAIQSEIPKVLAQDIQSQLQGPVTESTKTEVSKLVLGNLPRLVQEEVQRQLKGRIKEILTEVVKLDIIFWRDEDGIGLTAQAILDGEVLVETSKEVPNLEVLKVS